VAWWRTAARNSYARRCLDDSRQRGELAADPYRAIELSATVTAVYCDHGITDSMLLQMAHRPDGAALDFRWIETPRERRRSVCPCGQALAPNGRRLCVLCEDMAMTVTKGSLQ